MSSFYTPKYQMPSNFTILRKHVDQERYDKLVDRFLDTYVPRVEYFNTPRLEKEEKERLAFLLEVSPKPTTKSFIETPAILLTLITKEP